MKQIIVTIEPNGETNIHTVGFAGVSCKEASKFLEDALGKKSSDLPTAEAFKQTVTQGVTQ